MNKKKCKIILPIVLAAVVLAGAGIWQATRPKEVTNYDVEFEAAQEAPEQETSENFLKLKETLYEYAGNCPVYMYFLGTKKMIKGNREFWIDGSNKAFKALQKLLGKNSIKQR